MESMLITDVIDLVLYDEPTDDDDQLDYTNTTVDFALTPLHFPHIVDACNCLGNESSLGAGDGEFEETVMIYSAFPNESWELTSNKGMLTTRSELVPLGTQLAQTGEEYGFYIYTMRIRHLDKKGYAATFFNGKSEVVINNFCSYAASCQFDIATSEDGTPGEVTMSTKQTFIIGVNSTPVCDTLIVCDGESEIMTDGLVDGLYTDTTARDDQYSICPQNPWQRLMVTFTEFSTAPGDKLLVYDGKTITDPLIGEFEGEGVSLTGGWVAANCDPDTNATGCLTFRFITNGDTLKSIGWQGNISCTERNIKLTPPNNEITKLECAEAYGIVEIEPATIKSDCGAIQDSQLVRIIGAGGEICLDTCLAGNDTVKDTFGIGTYIVEYTLKSDPVKTTKGTFSVQAPNLVCNDKVTIPFGSNCGAFISPDDLLENPCDTLQDTLYYFISLIGKDKNGQEKVLATGGGKGQNYPLITSEMIGDCKGTITAKIERRYYDGLNLNFCNNGPISSICSVEIDLIDDSAPIFLDLPAVDTFVNCIEGLTQTELGLEIPKATDNCAEPTVVFGGAKIVNQGSTICDTSRVEITWIATDACGNSTNATQMRLYVRPRIEDIVKTSRINLSCGGEITADDITTAPRIKIGKLKNGVLEPSDTIDLSTEVYTCGYILQKRDVAIPASDCGKKIFRYWSILDWCDASGGVEGIDTTLIEFRDTLAPKFIDTIIIARDIVLDHDACTYDIAKKSKPIATDNCATPSVRLNKVSRIENNSLWDVNPANWSALDCDSFQLQWIAEDHCHEQLINDTLNEIIVIKDLTKPSVICTNKINISLGKTEATLHYRDIDAGSSDACGIKLYEVSKDEINWDSTVLFSCEDAHQEVKTYLRVTDHKGNQNTCWMNVNVEDKISPICSDLPDMEGSCDEGHFDQFINTDIDKNGKMADNEWIDMDAELAEYFNTKYGNPNCSDNVNCGSLVLEQQYQFIEKTCGRAAIKRRFRAIDWDGAGMKSNWVEQNISIETKANWSFTLPADWRGVCGESVPNSEALITNGACDLMAYEMEEKVFTTVEDACLKVVRTFIFTNWCNYVAGEEVAQITRIENEHGMVPEPIIITAEDYENIGRLEYVQILKLKDDTPPVISINPVNDCINNSDCMEEKRFSISATDCNEQSTNALNYDWVLFQNNTIIDQGEGASFSREVGTTDRLSIDWIVTDNCGNVAKEKVDYYFVDCKKPSPYCLHGTAIELMSSGMIQVWAKDIELNSNDNCTSEDKLLYKIWHESLGEAPAHIAEVHSLPEVLTFDCTMLGTQTVGLYVIDEGNNWDFCITYVNVQDNMDGCSNIGSPNGMAVVNGTIMDWKQQTIENVTVHAMEEMEMNTREDGQFQFELETNRRYTIRPEKKGQALNGVSTYDLVLISKHILGNKPLDNPYQMIAADVNQSGTITAFDMILIRQLILNIRNEFPNGSNWKFVAANHQFTTNNPLTEYYPEVSIISNLQEDRELDFVGIKMGDVNGNATANRLTQLESRKSNEIFEIITEDKILKVGEIYSLTFQTKQKEKILGYQFTLAYDNIKIEKLKDGVGGTENFGIHELEEGYITASWNRSANTNNHLEVESNQLKELFKIDYMALSNGKLSEQINLLHQPTATEAYDVNGDIMDIQLTFTDPVFQDEFELYQNTPNPFHDETTIGFYLPGNSEVQLNIRDELGRIIKTYKADYVKGFNAIQIKHEEINSGVNYYQLSTKFGSKTKKMLKLK